MSFATLQPSKKLTAPGYFDFSSEQKPATRNIFKWIDSAMQVWIDQTNLMDSVFRLWQTRDYSTATITRTPFVAYQLNRWGIGWFQGTDTQAAALVGLVSRSYSFSTATNFQYLFSRLILSPFLWVNNSEQIIYGAQYSSISSENLIIFSNAGSPPSTPAPQTYIARQWLAPTDWTLLASSSTYFSRGYLSGGNIVWMTPQSTATVFPYYNVTNQAGLPVGPPIGSVAGVEADGTGDIGAVYYYDGAVWRKTSTENPNQGQINVDGSVPPLQPRAVTAPNPDTAPNPITSNVRPPSTGPSQGYGMYAGLSDTILQSNKISVIIDITTAGFANLGIIINLMRRIKPTLNQLSLFYTINGNASTLAQIEIKDSGAIA